MIALSKARIAGSHLCSWGFAFDPGNPGCENVALPGFDLCPAHEKISKHLEAVAAECPEDWDDEPCCMAPITSGDRYQHEPGCFSPLNIRIALGEFR